MFIAALCSPIAWLEAEIAQMGKDTMQCCRATFGLAQRAALYRTVPGLGPVTPATLAAFLTPNRAGVGYRAPDLPWWDWRHGPGTAAASGDREQSGAEGV